MVTDEMVDKAARCIDPDAFAILDGGDKWRIIHSHHQREATKTKARAALEAALSAAEPVGYLFQMFYPGSKTWSADMFSDHEPTKNLPAEHMRNVRPLYAAPPALSAQVQDGAGYEAERLRRMVEHRDEFIIGNGLWDAFKEAAHGRN